MAAPTSPSGAVPQETLITIKVSVNDSLKKLKLPLKDLGANVLPDKVSHVTQASPPSPSLALPLSAHRKHKSYHNYAY